MEKPKKVIKDVRVVNLQDVSPKFILRPKVIEAIRREMLHDMKHGLNRTPSGARAAWQTPGPLRQLIDRVKALYAKI